MTHRLRIMFVITQKIFIISLTKFFFNRYWTTIWTEKTCLLFQPNNIDFLQMHLHITNQYIWNECIFNFQWKSRLSWFDSFSFFRIFLCPNDFSFRSNILTYSIINEFIFISSVISVLYWQGDVSINMHKTFEIFILFY